MTNVKQAFDDAGISMPYPQRVVSGRGETADALATRQLVERDD